MEKSDDTRFDGPADLWTEPWRSTEHDIQGAANCDVFSVLKRLDEKHTTERACDNPRFAEDMAREVAFRLRQDFDLAPCWIGVESFYIESQPFRLCGGRVGIIF